MPNVRLHLRAIRLPGSPFAPARPGGRLFGLALVGTGFLLLAVAAAPVLVGAQSTITSAGVVDPGVRGGSPGAGGALPGLAAPEQSFFDVAEETFQEVDDVPGEGLGPRFNMDGCAGCHAQPAVGGTSPALNPQIAVATKLGARNRIPAFITAEGPVREARFKSDGGVHDLFVISGRSDAPAACGIVQPNFGQEAANNNLSFRIPTPTFGAGLIESIPETTILNNKADNAGRKASLGITGKENRNGNDGTITRFGWKAQNKSLLIFSGEAYNVEQGVANELFPQEREENSDCAKNGLPEDHTHFTLTTAADIPDVPSDAVQFSLFMKFLAAPTPAPFSASAARGQTTFNQVGCSMCHTPQLTTGHSSVTALDNKPVNLYSDLLVHNMGSDLADGIPQGNANGPEFRTAPLWGVGQRIFFMHDGRTKNIVEAITLHQSAGSEANGVIRNFRNLAPGQRQDIVNFLRSL